NQRTGDEVDRVWRQYVGQLTGAPVEIVLSHPYEGVQWLAIDRASGHVLSARGLPLPSPDGRVLAVAASDATFDMHGVELFENGQDGFVSVAGFDAVQSPCDLHWEGPDRLALQVGEGSAGDALHWRPAAVVRRGEEWTLEGPP